MKIISFILCLIFYSCVSSKEPSFPRRDPGDHILTTDKKAKKENIKLQKEQAETARKKREELSKYSEKNSTKTPKIKKSKKK